jgi:hypothetical protein
MPIEAGRGVIFLEICTKGFLMRRSLVHSLPLAIAAIAAVGMLTAATGAELDKERQLYMLMRVELENAQTMANNLRSMAVRSAEILGNAVGRNNANLFDKGCFETPPRYPELCKALDGEAFRRLQPLMVYQDLIADASDAQFEEVSRLRGEFNAATINYITKVATQTALTRVQPPVQQQQPQRQAAPGTRQSNSDLQRILQETQRRLQGLQPLSRRGF